MIKNLIKTIQEKLLLKIEEKTTWGKNELKNLILNVFVEVLSEIIENINE